MAVVAGAATAVTAIFAAGDVGKYAAEALIGEGIPTTLRYFAWLACGLLVLAAVVALVATLMKAKPRKASPAVGAGVAVILLVAGALPTAGALVDVAQNRYGNPDHTTATAAPPSAADLGAPTWQHQRWHRDAPPGETFERDVAVVPERGLVVRTDISNEGPDMLRVLDAHTGVERWHDEIGALSVFVDAHDGRLLVVDAPAAVVFDLETGHILGTARLPATDPSFGWHQLASMSDAASRLAVTGRTVVLGNSSSRTEQVLALDVVTLRMAEIDRNPGGCNYAVPQGSTDVVQLIRYNCATPTKPSLEWTCPRPVFAAGDRIYVPGRGTGQGMAILDAHTLAQLMTVPDPCDVTVRAAVGSVGLVQCHDGRLLAFD